MITLQCRLSFETEADRQAVLDLIRRWSACKRFAYQRLLEGVDRETLKRELPKIFGLNTRYADDAIKEAKELMASREELGLSLRKVVFGGRLLFEKLHRRHLTGERRTELLNRWRERRQGNLYSRGDRSKKGNLNLRFVWREEGLWLRVNVGERRYVYARVCRKVQPGRADRDRWCDFVLDLHLAERKDEWFPYSVRLKLEEGS